MTRERSQSNDVIVMAHGGGGMLTREIIDEIILNELGNSILNKLDDAACLDLESTAIVMTTDSFVIDPIFFPGGDIGMLAVCGTVNDVVMQGAEPKYLSLAFIIEEGLTYHDFRLIVRSIRDAAKENGVIVVTGDTKVVEHRSARRNGGGIFINTSGIGIRSPGINVGVENARPGDVLIASGTLGDHGIAIMNARGDLGLETSLVSDTAGLWPMISLLFDAVPGLRCLRDPTRGGVAAAVCDIAEASRCCVILEEKSLPVRREVRGACDLLGMDPLNVANEGKAVVVCGADDYETVLKVLRSHPLGRNACVIGKIADEPEGMVLMKTIAGGERIVDMPTGESLPRIC